MKIIWAQGWRVIPFYTGVQGWQGRSWQRGRSLRRRTRTKSVNKNGKYNKNFNEKENEKNENEKEKKGE